MAISVIQRVSGIDIANNGDHTITITEPTEGNLLIAVGSSRDSPSSGDLSLTGITGWTKLDEVLNVGADGMSIAIWYKTAAASEGTSLTINSTTSVTKPGIYFVEVDGDWSDLGTNAPKSSGNSGTGTSATTGSTSATTVASAFSVASVVAHGDAGGYSSWLNSFTEQADLDATGDGGNRIVLGAADKTESATGTKSSGATIAASSDWAAVIGVFEEASNAFPSAPTNLTATAVSTSQINLSWDAVSGAGGYDIERDGSVIASDQAGTTYNDTGLNTGQSYDYRVRAVS